MLDTLPSVLTHALALAVGAVIGASALVILFAADARRVVLEEPSGEIPEPETVQATATVVTPEPTEADDDVAGRQLQMLRELEEAERLRGTARPVDHDEPPFVELAQQRQTWPPRLGGRNPYDRLIEIFDASGGEPVALPDLRASLHHVADLLVVLLTQLEIHGKRHGYGQTAANMVQLRQRAEAIRAELAPAAAQEPTV